MPRGKLRPPSPHVRYWTVGQSALAVGLERSVLKAAFDSGLIPSAVLPGESRGVRRARKRDVEAWIAQYEAELEAAR